MKPSEQAQVNFIADCLRKGEQRKDILAKFVKKWQKAGTRTFDRRLKVAQAAVQEEQKRIRATAEDNVAKEADALKSKIMTSLERQAYLTQIIKGEVEIPYKEIKWDSEQKKFVTISFVELAPHNARISAIAELNKMDGSYSPDKHEHSIAGQLPSWLKPK